jgi:hypothetical protein
VSDVNGAYAAIKAARRNEIRICRHNSCPFCDANPT